MYAKALEAFKEYRKPLHSYLMRRLRHSQDVDDLASEVYLRLCRIPDEKIVEKPLAYVYGLASNVLADWRIEQARSEAPGHNYGLSINEDDWEFLPELVLPDDLAERMNLQQQIDRAVAQLPATHAAVLLAHKRDGLSYDEVAEKLGLSIHTVEKYVTQAKARVRNMWWDR